MQPFDAPGFVLLVVADWGRPWESWWVHPKVAYAVASPLLVGFRSILESLSCDLCALSGSGTTLRILNGDGDLRLPRLV